MEKNTNLNVQTVAENDAVTTNEAICAIEKSQLGFKQQLIMQCLWDMGGEAVKQELMDLLKKKYGIAMTRQAMNVSTQVLIEKGYIKVTDRIGNAYVFKALIDREEFQINELKRFKKLTFGDSVKQMLSAFMKSDVTQEELDEIRALIEKDL